MKLLGRNMGLTLIETMGTAVIVAFVTLAVVNLLSRVYQGITSSQLMTTAYENMSDNIDKYRRQGFASLIPNPPNLYTLAAIKAGGASYWYEENTVGNTVFEIYRIIQYAEENGAGDLQGIAPCESGCSTNIKMVTIHVQYLDRGNNMVKSAERVAYVSNREVPSEGSSIAGTLSSTPALALANNPMVYVTGHPELSTAGTLSAGAIVYKIKNLQPGKYSLWAEATGYYPTTYTVNPVNISNTVQAVTGINIVLTPADTGTLVGAVYTERLVKQVGSPNTSASVTLSATGIYNLVAPPLTLWTNNVPPNTNAQMGAALFSSGDGLAASTVDHTSANALTTEFTDTNQPDRPYVVEFDVLYTAAGVGGTDRLRVYFSKASTGSPTWSNFWNIQPNTWLLAATTDVDAVLPNNYYTDIALANGTNLSTTDITTLYDESSQWTQAQVNNTFGVKLTAIGTNFTNLSVDSIYLNLHYPQDPAGGVVIYSTDGLSTQTMTQSDGTYTLANIKTGPGNATNTITAKANQSSSGLICTRQNLIISKAQTKTVNYILLQPPAGMTGTISGRVVDITTNLGIASASITYTLDSNGATFTATSDASGNFIISSLPNGGTGCLIAAKANYIQTSNCSTIVGPSKTITMKPTGKISGRVTNNTTSAGIDGIKVVAKNSAGGQDASAYTSGGGYYTVTVTAGGTDTYSVETVLDGTQYRCVFPTSEGGKIININVGTGTTVTNENFRLDYSLQPITGSAAINNPTGSDVTIRDGALIIAQPVGNTVMAQGDSGAYFSTLNDGDEQNTYYRTVCPSYSTYTKSDGTYSVMVPVYGGNYDIYAYYTYTTLTTTIINQNVFPPKYQKNRTNYYKKITGQAPNSSGVNFSGAWLAY